MLKFGLNQKNTLVEWLKAKKIDIDYNEISAFKQYMQFEEMQARTYGLYEPNEYESLTIEEDTLKDDKLTMYAGKKALLSGKVKMLKMGDYQTFNNYPKYDFSAIVGINGAMLEKGKLELLVNNNAINKQIPYFDENNIDYIFVIDRNKHQVYAFYCVDDLKGIPDRLRKESKELESSLEKYTKEINKAKQEYINARKAMAKAEENYTIAERRSFQLRVTADILEDLQ